MITMNWTLTGLNWTILLKCLEITFVVLWCILNKAELNLSSNCIHCQPVFNFISYFEWNIFSFSLCSSITVSSKITSERWPELQFSPIIFELWIFSPDLEVRGLFNLPQTLSNTQKSHINTSVNCDSEVFVSGQIFRPLTGWIIWNTAPVKERILQVLHTETDPKQQ